MGHEVRGERKIVVYVPYALGLVMNSKCIMLVLAPMKALVDKSLLRASSIWASWGLKSEEASCKSVAHSPALLLVANSAGTHPKGPVPVTRTFLTPSSYSLYIIHFKKSNIRKLCCVYNFRQKYLYKFHSNISL